MKGKKVALKILKAESFMSTSRDVLSREVLEKYSLTLGSSASGMYFSHDFFTGTFTCELLVS